MDGKKSKQICFINFDRFKTTYLHKFTHQRGEVFSVGQQESEQLAEVLVDGRLEDVQPLV